MLSHAIVIRLQASQPSSRPVLYSFSTGNASFGMLRVLAGLCWVVLCCSTTLVLEMPRLGSWLSTYWKYLVWDVAGPGWVVLCCSTTLVLGNAWIVLCSSTTLVLGLPRLGCYRVLAVFWREGMFSPTASCFRNLFGPLVGRTLGGWCFVVVQL